MSGQELMALADRLDDLRTSFEVQHKESIERVLAAAHELSKSWSGSNLGYHADVYYAELRPRPPGAQFSSEWGLGERFSRLGSKGDWREFSREEVRAEILRRAGDPDLDEVRSTSNDAAKSYRTLQPEVVSLLSLESESDSYVKGLLERAKQCDIRDISDLVQAQVPSGQVMTRDTLAATQGRRAAVHQSVIAEMWSLQQPALCAGELSEIARQAGSHLIRKERHARRSQLVGTNVFIGHGRSGAWRQLKDFIRDRLQLPYDEFNRVPVAGITNIARLGEMLDSAAIAFIVLTAEDELADGRQQARMNVIHEVGLFQGRLGFTKAIVLLEDGCEEFSNIQGLGQIRFPSANIGAAFEEVRLVLEREELV